MACTEGAAVVSSALPLLMDCLEQCSHDADVVAAAAGCLRALAASGHPRAVGAAHAGLPGVLQAAGTHVADPAATAAAALTGVAKSIWLGPGGTRGPG
jgi:hypothetical protein